MRVTRGGTTRAGAGALLLGCALWGATPALADDATVTTAPDNTFNPSEVTVDVGDTVTWTNDGGFEHTVTSSSSNWSKSASIRVVGQSTSYSFTSPGTYGYYCETHGSPSDGMRGRVIVRGAASPTPKPSASPSKSATPKPSPTPSRSATASPSASPSRSATPSSAPTQRPAATSTAPQPSPEPDDDPTLGEVVVENTVGLTAPPPSGRKRGLPIALAIVAVTGVASAHLRTLLAVPVRREDDE